MAYVVNVQSHQHPAAIVMSQLRGAPAQAPSAPADDVGDHLANLKLMLVPVTWDLLDQLLEEQRCVSHQVSVHFGEQLV
jgi:hypothetical protein